MPIISKAKTIDLGTLEWTLYTSHIFYTIIDDSVLNTNNKTGRIYCDIYKTVTYDVLRNKTIDKTIALGINHVIGIYDSSYSTAASFKAAMSGVMLTYETVDTVEECIINSIKKDNILSHRWLLSGTQGPGHFYTTTVNYAFIDNPIIYIDGYEYKGTRSVFPWWDSSDKSFTIYKGAVENIREIYIHDSSCDTLDEFLQSATGKKITYQVNPYEEVIL